jgi:arginase
MDLAIIGVPYAWDDYQSGVGAAPSAWQTAGLVERLASLVTRAIWVSLPPPTAGWAKEQQRIAIGCQLRETVRMVYAAGTLPLVLGGDSGLCALGTVTGLQHADKQPGIAWFDAHSRFSPTEPLALLTGQDETSPSRGIGIKATPDWHILLAGAREFEPDAATLLDESAVTLWCAQDLEIAGANELGRAVADWPSVYLHLDLNVLDPALMPSVDAAVPGGLALETVLAGIESIAAAGRVDAIGITGYNPSLDKDGQGLATSMQAIEAAVRILAV